jgi:hypothetical protein
VCEKSKPSLSCVYNNSKLCDEVSVVMNALTSEVLEIQFPWNRKGLSIYAHRRTRSLNSGHLNSEDRAILNFI